MKPKCSFNGFFYNSWTLTLDWSFWVRETIFYKFWFKKSSLNNLLLIHFLPMVCYIDFKIILNYFYKKRFQIDYISLSISYFCFKSLNIVYLWLSSCNQVKSYPSWLSMHYSDGNVVQDFVKKQPIAVTYGKYQISKCFSVSSRTTYYWSHIHITGQSNMKKR